MDIIEEASTSSLGEEALIVSITKVEVVVVVIVVTVSIHWRLVVDVKKIRAQVTEQVSAMLGVRSLQEWKMAQLNQGSNRIGVAVLQTGGVSHSDLHAVRLSLKLRKCNGALLIILLMLLETSRTYLLEFLLF